MISPSKVFLLLFIFFVGISFSVLSQNERKLTKISLLYNQKHYRLAVWKAENLENLPEYDTSYIPTFYKSLSLFHVEGRVFFKHREIAPWEEGALLFNQIKQTAEGKIIIYKHLTEVEGLRRYLYQELNTLKSKHDKRNYERLNKILLTLFDGVQLKNSDLKNSEQPTKSNQVGEVNREVVVEIASNEIGVPYLFGGTSPEGFDCSGFTCYVFQKANIQLGRSSRDQFQNCKKIDRENVKKGDLIFFNNGSDEVSHVGIVISNPDEPLKMIHASTSKGIVISEVENSEYWMKKLHGFGTFF